MFLSMGDKCSWIWLRYRELHTQEESMVQRWEDQAQTQVLGDQRLCSAPGLAPSAF